MGRFEVIVDLGGRARIVVDADFEDQAEEKALAAIWEKPRLYLDSTRVTVREVEEWGT